MVIHKCDKCGMNRTRNKCYYCDVFAARKR
jgi:hypothetical protein